MNAARLIDDCWNRIGVQGDGTCAALDAHIHCRNCQVYSASAKDLLDRPVPEGERHQNTQHFAKPQEDSDPGTESVLLLRCGEERLAVATTICTEVASHRSIHTLPHRRHAAVLGLANVRGELVVCLSLSALLGAHASPSQRRDDAPSRLLILSAEPAPVALHVDEVLGTHRYSRHELTGVPETLGKNANSTPTVGSAVPARRMRGTIRWKGKGVGVLDTHGLLETITRSLA